MRASRLLVRELLIGYIVIPSEIYSGASYEKKAKKNTYDAADEHTRYINLLSSLGPELTQEK